MTADFTYEVLFSREEGYVCVVAKGSIRLQSLEQMYASVLENPQYGRGMGRLWDFRQLDVALISSYHLERFAQFMKKKGLGIDAAYSAILVKRDLEFGMVRMLQGLGDGVLSPNVLVTRSQDEALAWITKRRTGDSDEETETSTT